MRSSIQKERRAARPADHSPPSADGARRDGARPSGRLGKISTARRRTRLALALIVAGALLIAYAATVVFWRDPLTDLYARAKQRELSASLAASFGDYREDFKRRLSETRAQQAERSRLAAQEEVTRLASRFEARLQVGQPMGRIIVPELGLNGVFIHGTRWAQDLSRGPGHYPETSVPGRGRTVAIAGHRTTFGAPFRHIDSLQRGDLIRLVLPYGTFEYRVFRHRVVDDEDWSIIRERGFDTVVLSACHPLYSAKQRWVVFGKLGRVDPVVGRSYRPLTDSA